MHIGDRCAACGRKIEKSIAPEGLCVRCENIAAEVCQMMSTCIGVVQDGDCYGVHCPIARAVQGQ